MNDIKRGQIYYADLSPIVGSEQDGYRPVLILQNDMGNRFSPTTIVAPITSTKLNTHFPTHVRVDIEGFDKDTLREKLFQRAALCYRQIGNEAYIENQLRCILGQSECLESFNAELTNKIVKQIRLSEDGSVRIILINEQEVRKEQTDHASSSPSDAT